MSHLLVEKEDGAEDKKMKRRMHFDYETYCELELKKVGAHTYCAHPSFEILMCAYAFDDGEVNHWDRTKSFNPPYDFMRALKDPKFLKIAWNAKFEYWSTFYGLGYDIPSHEIRDTMGMAYMLTLPGKLDTAGKILGLNEDQLKSSAKGGRLMQKFSKPCKPTKANPNRFRRDSTTDPLDWLEFVEYNKQDVVADRECFYRMEQYLPYDYEWEIFNIDFEINKRGIPLNRKMLEGATYLIDNEIKYLNNTLKNLTGLKNPNSQKQFLSWVKNENYPYDDIKAASVSKALKNQVCSEIGSLALRNLQQIKKTSVKKYYKALNILGESETVKDQIQIWGASRTKRFGGRGLQPQNLPRGHKDFSDFETQKRLSNDVENLSYGLFRSKYGDSTMDAISSAIRTSVKPKNGNLIAKADLAAIEYVTIGYLFRDEKIMQVCREGLDPYASFAPHMLGMTYEECMQRKKEGDGYYRNLCKPPVLGGGFGLGAGKEIWQPDLEEFRYTGLMAYARSMFVEMTVDQAQNAIQAYRKNHKTVRDGWYSLEKAFKKAMTGIEVKYNDWITIYPEYPFIIVELPSGNTLYYLLPKIKEFTDKWPDGQIRHNKQIYYLNVKSQQKASGDLVGFEDEKEYYDAGMCYVSTWGGKLTENLVQAIARDILVHGIKNAYDAGLDVFMHIHDEILIETDKKSSEKNLEKLISCMTDVPKWAGDMVLKAEGEITPFFRKD